jgi:capsid protein
VRIPDIIKNIFTEKFWFGEQSSQPQHKEQPQAANQGLIPYSTQNPWLSTKTSGGKTRRGLSVYQKNLILDHYPLRQNNRAAVHDSPQARLILKRQVDVTIGAGLKLDPTPVYKILGMTPEQSEKWADDVKEKFHLWAKSKNSDATGINTFYQNQRFYAWQYGRDGDIFVRFSYSKDKSLINPLQISFIDPNQIAGDEITFSQGPVTQDDGIKKDKNGKEIEAKVWINDPQKTGSYKSVDIPFVDKKSGLPILAHGYNPEYTGQTRGLPEMSHAIQAFEDIETFDYNTNKKMSNSAALNFTVQNKLTDPSDAGFSSLDNGSNAGTLITNSDETISAAPQTFDASAVTACNLPESTLTEAGVNMLASRQGDEIKLIESAAPPEGSGEYMMSKFNILCASVGISPEMAKMLFTNSHAASRAAMGLQSAVIKIKVSDIDADLINLVYFAWLYLEIAAGRVKAPGFFDPELREAWLSHVLRIQPLPDVDPAKTRQAVRIALEDGLTDYDTEALNYNGSDGKQNREKQKKQVPDLPPLRATTGDTEDDADEDDKDDD